MSSYLTDKQAKLLGELMVETKTYLVEFDDICGLDRQEATQLISYLLELKKEQKNKR